MSQMETTILAIEHIVRTPGVLGGKPRISGRRVPVHQIVYLHEHQGVTVTDLVEGFDISPAQVYAALAYYYDHREEIDTLIRELERLEPDPQAVAHRKAIARRWQVRTGYDPDQEMTAAEVAEVYGISPQAVREACQMVWVDAHKSGNTWL